MGEFTGERVIPGEVDVDLLNEHLGRYAFAARQARGKRVLDAGCGTGYGSAQLAKVARQVVGIEIAAEVLEAARRQYTAPRLVYLCADCRYLPFPDGCFDLVVAFEVIEHLHDWERLLADARRVLSPAGQLIVSTPNRLYYTESRREPNPYHVHEFDYQEFGAALAEHFPHVRMFLQNHSEGVVFSLPEATEMELFVEPGAESRPVDPTTSHFFLAVCSAQPALSSPPFIYLPQSGNVLRQRERHIALLQGELQQKDQWLDEAKQSLDQLHRAHQALEQEAIEDRRRAQATVQALEQENAGKTEWGRQLEAEIERLKGIIEKLQVELEEQSQWAQKLDAERSEILANYQRLDAEAANLRGDLKTAVDQLERTEAELLARTEWAQQLQRQVEQLTADLNSIFGSLAYRIGKRLGLVKSPSSDPKARR
jgi:SAM-dependent methyltransferase